MSVIPEAPGRLRCPVPEWTDAGPHYCPRCRQVLKEYLWTFQGEWYCSAEHALGASPRHTLIARTHTGAIDWRQYYEGYYGRAVS